MKLTKDNYSTIIPIQEQLLFSVILDSLKYINEYINDNQMFIDWQDYHDEYSEERTDPCIDFYGSYTIRYEHNPQNVIGSRMTIEELDNILSFLYEMYLLKTEK